MLVTSVLDVLLSVPVVVVFVVSVLWVVPLLDVSYDVVVLLLPVLAISLLLSSLSVLVDVRLSVPESVAFTVPSVVDVEFVVRPALPSTLRVVVTLCTR